MKFFWLGLAPLLSTGFWIPGAGSTPETPTHKPSYASFADYREAIARTAAMTADRHAQALADRYGLDILNLTWEDTGRYKGSSVGPNISDMTLQVAIENPKTRELEVSLMPILRFPNFEDLTADVSPEEFSLLVGNEKGRPLKRVSLRDFLQSPSRYMSNPRSWRGTSRSLLAPRDSKVLVSAQACFLPIPKSGKATFNPVLFNYQSRQGDPAVLTILATREGTSMTVIDNSRDGFGSGFSWGQRLFHNAAGQRASLTGERLSDFRPNGKPNSLKGVTAADESLNCVLVIQVPLKQKSPMRKGDVFTLSNAPTAAASRGSDVENAVIAHGDLEGPFTEVDNLAIERDPRFPVRVTVQFYKATSNGIVDSADMAALSRDIKGVYSGAGAVGSLVTGGETGRITEYEGQKVQPAGWWNEFWKRYEQETGVRRSVAQTKLKELLGEGFMSRQVTGLYVRSLLRNEGKLAPAVRDTTYSNAVGSK